MIYSVFGILAALTLVIENWEILFKRLEDRKAKAKKLYKIFLYVILTYYITDILWGILDSRHLVTLLYIDTLIYYLAMAAGILYWSRYVIAYLKDDSAYGVFFSWAGRIFFTAAAVITVINIFTPVLFWFDESGTYQAAVARHILLIVQILLFLLTSVYTFVAILKKEDVHKRRYRAIAYFGIIMSVFLSIQFCFPLLPLYAIGYMLGTCLLHTFVINDEKEEYKHNLEEALEREKYHNAELKSAWELAYTDTLTGVKSKLAYVEIEEQMDTLIDKDDAPGFAVAVFDLNGLKEINDQLGHEYGDQYITEASHLICDIFKRSPVFRIGGDEFAVFLEGDDYQDRDGLMNKFDATIEKNEIDGGIVIAGGLSSYRKNQDHSFEDVFKRADQMMYKRKRELKRRYDNARETTQQKKDN